jgi:hypothetical protein
MSECIELAGFAAAQALCCLFDRIPVPPIAFSRKASGAATVTILPGGTPGEIAGRGQRWLDANDNRADDAVVVYDGYVTMAAIKKDALILDLRSYRATDCRLPDGCPVPAASSSARLRGPSSQVHRRRD